MKEMFCGQGVVQMQFVQCTKAQRTTLGTSRLWTKENQHNLRVQKKKKLKFNTG